MEEDEDDVGEKNEKDKIKRRKSENNRTKELARPKHVILALALHAYRPVRLAGSYRCWFVKKYC